MHKETKASPALPDPKDPWGLQEIPVPLAVSARLGLLALWALLASPAPKDLKGWSGLPDQWGLLVQLGQLGYRVARVQRERQERLGLLAQLEIKAQSGQLVLPERWELKARPDLQEPPDRRD